MNKSKETLQTNHTASNQALPMSSSTFVECHAQLDDTLRESLMQLPDPERLVLLLHDVAEMNVQEVAQEMTISGYLASRYHDSGWKRLRNGLKVAGVKSPEHIEGEHLQCAVCESGLVPQGLTERVLKTLERLPLPA